MKKFVMVLVVMMAVAAVFAKTNIKQEVDGNITIEVEAYTCYDEYFDNCNQDYIILPYIISNIPMSLVHFIAGKGYNKLINNNEIFVAHSDDIHGCIQVVVRKTGNKAKVWLQSNRIYHEYCEGEAENYDIYRAIYEIGKWFGWYWFEAFIKLCKAIDVKGAWD